MSSLPNLFFKTLGLGLLFVAGMTGALLPGNAIAGDLLDEGFAAPPASARPWVYWYFMDGNLTREGMTADLAAMQAAGIGGGIFLEVDLGLPRGPVKFMSPEWQDLVVNAIHEAEKRNLQIALGSGPGWCGTGGPWITPDLAMQALVASATNVAGPADFSGQLAQPSPRKPYFGEGTLTPELKKQWREFYRDEAVVAFPTPTGTNRIPELDEKALYYRAPFSSHPGVKAFLTASHDDAPLPPADYIQTGEVRDLSSHLSPDGRLDWQVPSGNWTILRLGRTLTGQTTRPSPLPGLGFETDKFDRAALAAHFADYVQKLLDKIGPRTNPAAGLTMLHFDSWEMSSQNWSPQFRTEFRHRRGYDPLPYLPVLAGKLVVSREVSERFLWDLRRTAQELTVDNHVGYLAELAHRNGLTFSLEPYDMNPAGDLTMGRVADVPQCEFWHLGYNTAFSVIEAASLAHTCGRPMVAAEAFTSSPGEDWKADPAALKRQGDWAFCQGVNRLDFHRFQAQPENNRRPGMTMQSYGVHWDRTQTWWDMVPAYHEYLARCQFLLQRGVTVADVCFLAAEDAPFVFRPPPSAVTGDPVDHLGYNFDGCAPETLLERATVKNGNLVFPGGSTYRVLVLPDRAAMTPALLHKIEQLVRAGATVFGPPPMQSPGLENYPKCDTEVRQLARDIWGDCDGRSVTEHRLGNGRVVWRTSERQPMDQYGDFALVTHLLEGMDTPPDFAANGPIRFTHRQDGDAEIYFLANREDKTVTVDCTFRVSGRQPELFDPITGETRDLPQFSRQEGRTTVPIRFEPEQSCFVIFRNAVTPHSVAKGDNFPELIGLPPVGASPGGLQISKAVYAAVDGFAEMDVTAMVAAQVHDGRLGLIVSSDQFGRDPAFRHVKELRVEYSEAGHNFTNRAPENDWLVLGGGQLVTGPWEVSFDPHWGGPAAVTFASLEDWSKQAEPGIKFYSGKAVYRKTIAVPPGAITTGGKYYLDLGVVKNLARVRLNGRDLGVVWCYPWRVNISEAIRAGDNQLEIEVANLWPNRLIGDQSLPAEKRFTWVSINRFNSHSPLMPSGLLGPVSILTTDH